MSDRGRIAWQGIPSALDAADNGMLSLEAAPHPQDDLRLTLSAWSDGRMLRQFSIGFESPMAVLAVEEALYSIAGTGDVPANVARLRETQRSPLLEVYSGISQEIGRGPLRHFMVAGNNICVEVLAPAGPTISGGDVQVMP